MYLMTWRLLRNQERFNRPRVEEGTVIYAKVTFTTANEWSIIFLIHTYIYIYLIYIYIYIKLISNLNYGFDDLCDTFIGGNGNKKNNDVKDIWTSKLP